MMVPCHDHVSPRKAEEALASTVRGFIYYFSECQETVVQTGTRNRRRIAVLIYSMTNAVIFGAGLITVLNVSALRVNAHIWIPIVVVASLILAAPIAWLIAPRLQARYDRRHTQ